MQALLDSLRKQYDHEPSEKLLTAIRTIEKEMNLHTTIITKQGTKIDCFGELLDNSNFEIICEDEEDDTVWTDGNPNHPEYVFKSWQEVCDTLEENVDGADIVEISAV